MSQPQTDKGKVAKPTTFKSWSLNAIFYPGGLSQPSIGGSSFGDTHEAAKIAVKLCSTRALEDPWMGFTMTFPLGADNEDKGFGQVHNCKSLGIPHTLQH